MEPTTTTMIPQPCPLCRSTGGRVRWSAPYAAIWDELRERWDAELSASYRAPWDADGTATLYECDGCGLQYFSPLRAGDAAFYEKLAHHPGYYVDDRWEFQQVLRSVSPDDAVIDFGSGEGAFLRRAAAVARRVVGCDHNEDTDASDLAGAELRHEPFDVVAASEPGAFDVATSFHVLEHLDDVAALCAPATQALRPGGRLFLSTPDRQRTIRNDLEALDCPPHHLSRWSPAQYAALADRFDLELVTVHHEPFVHVHGARRWVPTPVLHAAALARNRVRGLHVQRPRTATGGPWPRGAALMAEYVKR